MHTCKRSVVNYGAIMFEWLEGYWTALRHIAILREWGSPVEWVSAVASMLAAISAAIAAGLSLIVSRSAKKDALSIEKASIISHSNDIFIKLSQKSLDANLLHIDYIRKIRLDSRVAMDLANEVEIFKEISTSYDQLASSSLIDKRLETANSMQKLQDLREHLSAIRFAEHLLDKKCQGTKFKADMLFSAQD